MISGACFRRPSPGWCCSFEFDDDHARRRRRRVSISDRPGGLARLAEVIASTGASIKEIIHDRAFSGPDLSAVRVVCVVETTGHEHVAELHRTLANAGVRMVV
jgi:threonine dehydratase